jgi:hypothetical protein
MLVHPHQSGENCFAGKVQRFGSVREWRSDRPHGSDFAVVDNYPLIVSRGCARSIDDAHMFEHQYLCVFLDKRFERGRNLRPRSNRASADGNQHSEKSRIPHRALLRRKKIIADEIFLTEGGIVSPPRSLARFFLVRCREFAQRLHRGCCEILAVRVLWPSLGLGCVMILSHVVSCAIGDLGRLALIPTASSRCAIALSADNSARLKYSCLK